MIYVLSPNKKVLIFESETNENLKERTNRLLELLDIPIDFEQLIISNSKPLYCENAMDYKFIGNLLLDISTTGGGEGYSSKYAWTTKKKFKKKNTKKGIYKPFTEIISEDCGKPSCEKPVVKKGPNEYHNMLIKNGFSSTSDGESTLYSKKYKKDRTLNIHIGNKIRIIVMNDNNKLLSDHIYNPNGEFEKTKKFLLTKISQLIRVADRS